MSKGALLVTKRVEATLILKGENKGDMCISGLSFSSFEKKILTRIAIRVDL